MVLRFYTTGAALANNLEVLLPVYCSFSELKWSTLFKALVIDRHRIRVKMRCP
jgi:hypothetical protein